MKKLFTSAITVFATLLVCSAQSEFSASGSIDLYGNYLWRGSQVCGAHLMPYGEINYGAFTLDGCGYISFDNSYKEIDVELSYNFSDFTLTLSDYFSRYNDYDYLEDYCNWKKGESDHVLDLQLKYDSSAIPFRANWSSIILGSYNPEGESIMSHYLELQTYKTLGENGELSLTGGFGIGKGDYTECAQQFECVHLELKYSNAITSGDFSFPFSVSYMVNPYSKLGFVNASIGVAF